MGKCPSSYTVFPNLDEWGFQQEVSWGESEILFWWERVLGGGARKKRKKKKHPVTTGSRIGSWSVE